MRLTDQQKQAVLNQGNTLVVACPGSGKTRTIIARLLRCIEDIQGSPRRVACITYTNAAVHEIESRIRMNSINVEDNLCEASTIHAFCVNNILRSFHWKLDEYKGGFEVLPSDSEIYKQIVKEIAEKYLIDDFGQEQFELIGREPTGDPILPGNIPSDAAYEFWGRLQAEGYIDFSGIVYYSYILLRDNPSIVRYVASKFAHILVDEFQDTSAIQKEIFSLIHSWKLSEYFLVGDPEQSIYSFAGAKPELMNDFALEIGAQEFSLTGNYRSSTPIVEYAETIIERTPPMYAANSEMSFTEEPKYVISESNISAITDYFLPALDDLKIAYGRAAILAPNWYQLLPLGRRMRELGIPIVGPGARPYKRRHLFGRLAEPICEYLDNPTNGLIRQIEKELFFLISDITGKTNFTIFSYRGRRVVFQLIFEAKRIHGLADGAKPWLLSAATSFSEILIDENMIPEYSSPLFSESVEDMLNDIRSNRVDVENMITSDLGMFASSRNCIKLLTMHKAKGREFDAVAMISLHDGQIPYHNYYNPLDEIKEAESRRLFYVSVTRAKRLLLMFSRKTDRLPPSRFLN